jgi:hypothetical protein
MFFTFYLRWKLTQTDEARLGRFFPKVVALTSMAIWLIVAISARLIMLI